MDKQVQEAIVIAFEQCPELLDQHRQIDREQSLYNAARTGDRAAVAAALGARVAVNCRIRTEVIVTHHARLNSYSFSRMYRALFAYYRMVELLCTVQRLQVITISSHLFSLLEQILTFETRLF